MSKTPNRGTTPRSKIRTSNILPSPRTHYPISQETPIRSALLPKLIDFHDEYQDFESNMQDLENVSLNLRNFNESFASFMYGLQVNAYTVEFGRIPQGAKPDFIEHNEEVLAKINDLERELELLSRDGRDKENHDDHTSEDDDEVSDDDSFEMEPALPPPRPIQRQSMNSDKLSGQRKSLLPMRTSSTLNSHDVNDRARSTVNNNFGRTPTSTARPSSSSRRTVSAGIMGSAARVPVRTNRAVSNVSSNASASNARVLAYGRVNRNFSTSKNATSASKDDKSSLDKRPRFR